MDHGFFENKARFKEGTTIAYRSTVLGGDTPAEIELMERGRTIQLDKLTYSSSRRLERLFAGMGIGITVNSGHLYFAHCRNWSADYEDYLWRVHAYKPHGTEPLSIDAYERALWRYEREAQVAHEDGDYAKVLQLEQAIAI
jgi:hypothetical protein